MSDVPLKQREFDLLLLGKTGKGKSCTGNAIVGRNIFKTSGSTESLTKEVNVGWVEKGPYRIKVVDTPGFIDTVLQQAKSKELDMKSACENMARAMSLSKKGINALLFVVSYGDRDTPEDLQAFHMLESIFGPELLRDHAIIIVTKGDNFDSDMEDETPPLSFEDWCRKQKGGRKEIMERCRNRCVLFYNRGKDKERERENSIQELLSMVEEMTKRSGVYTHEHFEAVGKLRDGVIAKEGIPQFSIEILERLNLLEADIERCEESTSDADVKKLSQRFEELSDEIRRMEKKKLKFPPEFKTRVKEIAQNLSKLEELMKKRKQMPVAQFQPKKEAIVYEIKQEVSAITETTTPPSIWSSLARYGGKALLTAAVIGAGVATGGVAVGVAGAVAGFGAGTVGAIAAGMSREKETAKTTTTTQHRLTANYPVRELTGRTRRLQLKSSEDSDD